jgi:hypothetical protein
VAARLRSGGPTRGVREHALPHEGARGGELLALPLGLLEADVGSARELDELHLVHLPVLGLVRLEGQLGAPG